ncbi:hypothetical protein MPDQ_005302 [Monascus purpureus]|uniref:AhpC/TSA antioxidant enzyme-domain-containing protein n=1 Tax=Monascus purpureus TaxID=5098 RepID=A0A507R057_MONPU|nr:hypothetical protein MPDQ_005302 [Monascus purpureus]BDD58052.1 hypothetical protein MAP00_003362 [Monascus purpureus]
MSNQVFPRSPHPIPDEKTLSEAYALPVLSDQGNPIPFGDLIAPGGDAVTVIVIFIRHFFCTCDQDYIRSLSSDDSTLTPSSLSTLPPPRGPAKLLVIGCGDPSRINAYKAESSCAFPVFTDPTCCLHDKLQLKRSLSRGSDPSYTQNSLWGHIGRSLRQMARSGLGAFRGGEYSQNGGEWVFRDGRCEWVHRMEDTVDRVPGSELRKIIRGDDA